MLIASDTSPEANAAQIEAYRLMGGAGRAQVMYRLIAMTRETAEAGIRKRHPEYDAVRVMLALARLLHGDDLVGRAWPERDLVEP